MSVQCDPSPPCWDTCFSFYRSPPENQSLEQHQADEELDIKVTDKEQYNILHIIYRGLGLRLGSKSQVAHQAGSYLWFL